MCFGSWSGPASPCASAIWASGCWSRLIDRLENEGLIEREDCPDDARGQMLKLTRAGKALRAKVWPDYAAAIQAAVGDRLTGAEAETLAKLLEKLR
jgi:DNA-binding MarR family transcriptional regulator